MDVVWTRVLGLAKALEPSKRADLAFGVRLHNGWRVCAEENRERTMGIRHGSVSRALEDQLLPRVSSCQGSRKLQA